MSRLGNWWRHVRRHGLIASAGVFVDRVIYHSHRCVITWTSLDGPPQPDRIGDITFRLATPADFDHLAEFEHHGRGSTQRIYTERDSDWLFVACHGERIVATRRLGRVIRHPLISRVLELGPGQVWGADTFCLPDYRNRGIARNLQMYAERYLARLGYRERLGTIVATNTPSLRMSLASGSRFVSYVRYVRILCWERLHVSKSIPGRLLKAVGERRVIEAAGVGGADDEGG